MSPSDASCANNFGMSIDMLLLEIDSPAPFSMTVIIQRIREAIESIQPRDFSLVHDWVDENLFSLDAVIFGLVSGSLLMFFANLWPARGNITPRASRSPASRTRPRKSL